MPDGGIWPLQAWPTGILNAENFKGQAWIDFVRDHAEIPIFAVSLYLGIVFYLPPILKGRNHSMFYSKTLRLLFTLWNLMLATFSVIGAIHTVPLLYRTVMERGFHYSICTDPVEWYLDGEAGLWVGLFIFSKIPELLDTVFLVLQNKPVIFLHWFHHCTVMLYCWHAYHNRVAPGLWFAAMNYAVHSIMYTYYFAMAARLTWLAVPFAPLITTSQILQMAVGSAVTFASASTHHRHGASACKVDPANYKLGLAMYGSYLVLFCGLFINKYLPARAAPATGRLPRPDEAGGGAAASGGAANGGGSARARGVESEGGDRLCGVDLGRCDAAGRFADFSEARGPDKRD
jgi:elongation of very long chain fatty acids protein 6